MHACTCVGSIKENCWIYFTGSNEYKHQICWPWNIRICLTFKGKENLAGSGEGEQTKDRREPTKLISRKTDFRNF